MQKFLEKQCNIHFIIENKGWKQQKLSVLDTCGVQVLTYVVQSALLSSDMHLNVH
jgi:hypothetical protein